MSEESGNGYTRVYAYPSYNYSTDSDSSIVTIGYLKQRGLVTTATYTTANPFDNSDTSNDPGADDDQITTQTAVSVPAQITQESPATGVQGFQLLGKTTDDTTNSNYFLSR